MHKPATILVVDDQPFVRRTLCSLLAEQPHWDIHEAENGKVALDRSRTLKPHVVVMDIVMPLLIKLKTAYEIRHLAPETRIVLISSHYTPEEAAMLARLFGDGNFVQKSEAATKLTLAISRLLPDESKVEPV